MSTKQIAPTLGYDSKAGKYKFDPAKHTPFFAATYIKEKPDIVDPGIIQAMFVTPPEKNKKYYFAARFLSNDPRKAPIIPPGKEVPGPKELPSDKEIPDSNETPLPDANVDTPTKESETKGTPGCGCGVGSGAGSWWVLAVIGLLAFTQRKSRN